MREKLNRCKTLFGLDTETFFPFIQFLRSAKGNLYNLRASEGLHQDLFTKCIKTILENKERATIPAVMYLFQIAKNGEKNLDTFQKWVQETFETKGQDGSSVLPPIVQARMPYFINLIKDGAFCDISSGLSKKQLIGKKVSKGEFGIKAAIELAQRSFEQSDFSTSIKENISYESIQKSSIVVLDQYLKSTMEGKQASE